MIENIYPNTDTRNRVAVLSSGIISSNGFWLGSRKQELRGMKHISSVIEISSSRN